MKRELERQLVIHAEQQAEAAEREVAFFRNSVDILFVADVEDHDDGPEFVYEAVSPAFERITGLPAARLVGHRPDECLTSTTGVSVLAHYFACVETGVMVTYTDSYLLPVGTRDIEGSLTPIRHPSTGKVTRIAGLIRDVTERNQMESALRHTQKMEAIGRLAAGVAHDFNNLLQTMISGLELVLDDVAADTPAFEFADLALKAAHRGASLTRHLLAYARKQMLLPQAVDLNIALYDLQKLLSHVLDPQIAVMVQVDPDMKPAFADPGQLQTALLNLAMNAADAMASGGTLTLSACTTGYAGSEKIALCVSDTGSGMDAATLARAPDPFFTTKGPGGSGLGLSMVKGFAEQSGGDFAISSRPGAGTAVTVQLPCAQAAAAPPAAALLPRVSGRILLVDDASDVLVTTSAFLEKAGFSVVRAKDGTDALARLASGDHFDALVTDFAMPGMNGVDLIAEGRLIHPHLPALIITGFAEVRGQAELPDGVPVLRKPLTRLDLLKTIQQVTPAVIVR
jgi:PAS domain S-box-containing protein